MCTDTITASYHFAYFFFFYHSRMEGTSLEEVNKKIFNLSLCKVHQIEAAQQQIAAEHVGSNMRCLRHGGGFSPHYYGHCPVLNFSPTVNGF